MSACPKGEYQPARPDSQVWKPYLMAFIVAFSGELAFMWAIWGVPSIHGNLLAFAFFSEWMGLMTFGLNIWISNFIVDWQTKKA